ncbi:MAG TPA: cytochrome c [Myxococcota bacterium]|nr:cytochrome c [Myxococcota bacterium]
MQELVRTTRAFALSLGLFLLACGPGENRPAPAAPPEAPAPKAPAVPAPTPAPPAAAAPSGAVPANLGHGDASKGGAVYATNCASCHGPKGCGDGPLAATLNPKPAKHCDGTIMNPLTDEFIFKVIKLGGPSVGKSPLMAPWGGSLSDAQIVDVVAYVRTLAANPPYKP